MLILSMIVMVSGGAMVQAGAQDKGYPQTYWSKMGKTGTVMGRVSGGTGAMVPGAYVMIVNASNTGEVYAHTVSDNYGLYSFSGVSASYSSIQGLGADGKKSYNPFTDAMYMVIARMGANDGRCTEFGVDADNAGATTTSVVIWGYEPPVPTPSATIAATATPRASLGVNSPAPTATPQTTSTPASTQWTPTPEASKSAQPTPSAPVTPDPTPVPGLTNTPAPADSGISWPLLIIGLAIALAMVMAVAIFIFFRFRYL